MEAYQNEQDFINNYFDGLKISLFKKVFIFWSLETLDTDWHKVHVVTVTESDEILSIERHEGQVVLLRVVKFEQDWSDLVFLNLHNHMQIASKVRQMTDYGVSQFAYKESSKWIKINFNEEQINMS